MTSIQQQRLIGALLLVIFVIVLAYVVLAQVGDSSGTNQDEKEEPIDFSSVIEPIDGEGEALVDADTGTITSQSPTTSPAPSENITDSTELNEERVLEDEITGADREAAVEDQQASADTTKNESKDADETSQQSSTDQPQSQSKTAPPESGATESDKPTAVAEPNAGNPPPVGNRWAIQLGSFSVQKNAQSLKTEMEALGYKPYIENTQTAKGSVYRVRLPSMGSREDADKMAQRISDKLDINAQVMEQ